MNGRRGSSIVGVAIVLLLIGPSAFAVQPSTGFATYSISVVSPKGVHSVLVNETVNPSAKAGYSDLVLQLLGGEQNLTYSRLVNASESLFPFLPSLGTQSFDYNNGTAYSVHLNVTTSGTTPAMFKGGQYNLNVLTVSAAASFGGRSVRTNGTVETFPSTLVYSASLGNGTARLQALLQATDLPLVSTPPQTTTAAYIGAGLGIGALVLGGAFLMRRREKKAEKQGVKPLHWVD